MSTPTELDDAYSGATSTKAAPEPQPVAPRDETLTIIEPGSRGGLMEVWSFRELLYFLVWRDVAVRYKQTILGVGWAVAQPLATMAIFTAFLGRNSQIRANIPNYPLYVYAGMAAWSFFINVITGAGSSIVMNERLITKASFPRLLIPLSTVGVGLFDFAIGYGLLAILMLVYGVAPGWMLLWLPALLLALIGTAAGFGFLFAALTVGQRDFKYLLQFASQLWLFATPCIYMSPESLDPVVRRWAPLNPAFGLVQAVRQASLNQPIDWYSFNISATIGLTVLIAGVMYFRHAERDFADTI